MHPYVLKEIANQKIAEDRKWAVRYRLAVEAERARREVGQSARSPLAGLLRTLASAVEFRHPVQPTIAQEPRAE